MGRHRRFGGHYSDHGSSWGRRFAGPPAGAVPIRRPPLGRPRPLFWAIVIFGLGLWSLFAWIAWTSVDPVLGWLAGSSGLLSDGTKAAATAAGDGGVFGPVYIGGLLGQSVGFLHWIAKPGIIAVWAVGALGLLASPLILPWIIRLRGRPHH